MTIVHRLRIPAEMIRAMLDHLAAALPNEGCGLIAVDRDAGDDADALWFYPGSNLDLSPTRFTMDPAETIGAFRDMERRGWRLGGIIHSHPSTPPTPSPTDLRESFYPDAVFIIVSFANAVPEMRGWSLADAERPIDAAPVELVLNVNAEP